PDMLKGLELLRTQYMQAAQELYNNYEAIKEKQISVLDDEAGKIAYQNGMATASAEQKDILWKWLKVQQETHRKLYPDKDKLLAKYGVTWRMFKVDSLGDAEAELLSPEDAKVIAEQQAQLKKDMEDWVKAK